MAKGSQQGTRAGRSRARMLVAVSALVFVCWLLARRLGHGGTQPLVALAAASPLWLVAAAVLAAGGFVVATMSFVGFVPERLDLRRSFLAQLAGGFANLVAPGGLGGMALGSRFLNKSGIPAGQAVTSVGVSQVVGVLLHLLLVLGFGLAAGVQYHPDLSFARPSGVVLDLVLAAIVAVVAAAVAVVLAPALRRRAARWLRTTISGNLPRMVELTRRQPGKVAVGVTGQLLVSLVSSACLYTCGLALGLHPGFAAVTLANLIGGTLGQLTPTPGGVGGVEAALAYALQEAAGVPYGLALVQVVLYRALTLWLPLLPGWVAYVWLQRRDAL